MQDLITLISGLIIALVIFYLYNSSYTIRKKTREEAIQKLKLDSIIGIINGTKEFKKATKAVEYEIDLVEEKVGYYEPMPNVEQGQIILNIYSKFEEENKALSEKIENFIFLLNRDMIINGEDQDLKKEIEKIDEIEEIRKSIKNGFVISSRQFEGENLKEEEYDMIHDVVFDFIGRNPHTEINESIERILKVYKAKLDKKEEGWFKKLLDCPRKVKIILMKKRKRSRLQDEP